LERAAHGIGWLCLIALVSSVALTAIDDVLHPGFAAAWTHPALRLSILAQIFLSLGFIMLLRSGWLSNQRLLDLGMGFQVSVAFGGAVWEAGAYKAPTAVVFGVSRIAVWMTFCAWLMPNAPLKSVITAGLCVAMWPLGYWVDVQIFGYQPMLFKGIL